MSTSVFYKYRLYIIIGTLTLFALIYRATISSSATFPVFNSSTVDKLVEDQNIYLNLTLGHIQYSFKCPNQDDESSSEYDAGFAALKKRYDKRSRQSGCSSLWLNFKDQDIYKLTDILAHSLNLPEIAAKRKASNEGPPLVFDWGSGCGQNLNYMSEKYGVVGIGIDIMTVGVEYSNKIGSKYGNVFCSLNGERLGWLPESTLDAAYSFGSLLHLPSAEIQCRVIKQILTALKPGGIFISTLMQDYHATPEYFSSNCFHPQYHDMYGIDKIEYMHENKLFPDSTYGGWVLRIVKKASNQLISHDHPFHSFLPSLYHLHPKQPKHQTLLFFMIITKSNLKQILLNIRILKYDIDTSTTQLGFGFYVKEQTDKELIQSSIAKEVLHVYDTFFVFEHDKLKLFDAYMLFLNTFATTKDYQFVSYLGENSLPYRSGKSIIDLLWKGDNPGISTFLEKNLICDQDINLDDTHKSNLESLSDALHSYVSHSFGLSFGDYYKQIGKKWKLNSAKYPHHILSRSFVYYLNSDTSATALQYLLSTHATVSENDKIKIFFISCISNVRGGIYSRTRYWWPLFLINQLNNYIDDNYMSNQEYSKNIDEFIDSYKRALMFVNTHTDDIKVIELLGKRMDYSSKLDEIIKEL